LEAFDSVKAILIVNGTGNFFLAALPRITHHFDRVKKQKMPMMIAIHTQTERHPLFFLTPGAGLTGDASDWSQRSSNITCALKRVGFRETEITKALTVAPLSRIGARREASARLKWPNMVPDRFCTLTALLS
jgi:hypothetical protein